MFLFKEMGLSYRKAAEIAIDVYNLIASEKDVVEGLKELERRYKSFELVIAVWSYSHVIALASCAQNGMDWTLNTLTKNLMWINFAKEDREKAIEQMEKTLRDCDKLLKEAEDELRKTYW